MPPGNVLGWVKKGQATARDRVAVAEEADQGGINRPGKATLPGLFTMALRGPFL